MLTVILVGAGLLLASLMSYAVALSLIVHLVARLIRSGYDGRGFRKNFVVMSLVTLVTAVTHLAEIALWAAAFLACGAMSTFENAFYFSAQNYTALGYGDIIPSDRWRLLGPLEAINGLLLFGLSTAVLFAVMSRMITNHLRALVGREADAVLNQEPGELPPVEASQGREGRAGPRVEDSPGRGRGHG